MTIDGMDRALVEANATVEEQAAEIARLKAALDIAQSELRIAKASESDAWRNEAEIRAALANADAEISRMIKADDAAQSALKAELAHLRIDLQSTEEDRQSVIHERDKAYVALGRAVAVLDWALSHVVDNAAITTLPMYAEGRAVLADPTCAAAGEAYTRQLDAVKDARDQFSAMLMAVENVLDGTGTKVADRGEYASSRALVMARELEAVYDVARNLPMEGLSDEQFEAMQPLVLALAKVAARRGQ